MPVPAGSENRVASARERLRAFVDPAALGEAEPRRALEEPEPEEEAAPLVEPPAAGVAGGARRFERRHLVAVALLVACGLVFGVWQLMRARSVPVAPASVRASIAGSARPSISASAAPIVVHVVGAVQRPGVVRLAPGARVTDAIDAAGGLSPDADPAQLNLAAQLNDGEQVVVGTRGSPAGEVRGGPGGAAPGAGGPGSVGQVNLNTATQAQLEALPGVGPVTAGKILQWRQQHGRFTRVEELGEVDGIGPKTLAQLKPYVRV